MATANQGDYHLDFYFPAYGICDKLQVVFKELTRDGDKSMEVKTNLIRRKRQSK